MTKRITFAQKLEVVASMYDIRKLTLDEAILQESQYFTALQEQEQIRITKAKYDSGLFLMLAEAKPELQGETHFRKITQWQDPSKKQGYHWFVSYILYPVLDL